MSQNLSISRQTASKYLEQLLAKGYLEERKAGRERLFFIPQFIDILS